MADGDANRVSPKLTLTPKLQRRYTAEGQGQLFFVKLAEGISLTKKATARPRVAEAFAYGGASAKAHSGGASSPPGRPSIAQGGPSIPQNGPKKFSGQL